MLRLMEEILHQLIWTILHVCWGCKEMHCFHQVHFHYFHQKYHRNGSWKTLLQVDDLSIVISRPNHPNRKGDDLICFFLSSLRSGGRQFLKGNPCTILTPSSPWVEDRIMAMKPKWLISGQEAFLMNMIKTRDFDRQKLPGSESISKWC